MVARRITLAAAALIAGVGAFVAVGSARPSAAIAATTVPRPDHVVLVMLENKRYSQINANSSAPFLNSLASQGAKFSMSFGITHPSQPNYLAILSGSTQGITDDSCPHTFAGENLAHQLNSAGLSFKGFSESMPSNGYTGCTSGNYARKHNGWVDFSNVPASNNLTFASFPTDFTRLPSFSYVVPNLCNDMHDCSIGTGDSWLRSHLDAYAQWAKTHNSVLIVTFDEDSGTSTNQIFTVFVGQHVKVGSFTESINHYSILRTVEDAYGLAAVGGAATKSPITDIWN